MDVETGTWRSDDSLLALYKYYVNASESELEESGVTREQVLALIRELEFSDSSYRRTELVTIAAQMLRAFRAGQSIK